MICGEQSTSSFEIITLSIIFAGGCNVFELGRLAGGESSVRQVGFQGDFSRVTSAVWELSPFCVFVVLKLDDLDVSWVLLVVVDLNHG